jgi:hypothetical protein
MKKEMGHRVLVAHACTPSYSGGRDQEDGGLKPAWTNSSQDAILKKPFTKKGWLNDSRCWPSVQTPVLEKKKKKKEMGNTTQTSSSQALQVLSSI